MPLVIEADTAAAASATMGAASIPQPTMEVRSLQHADSHYSSSSSGGAAVAVLPSFPALTYPRPSDAVTSASWPTVEDTVGGTPLVRLQRLGGGLALANNNVLLLKLEGNNPAGSVKDRCACALGRQVRSWRKVGCSLQVAAPECKTHLRGEQWDLFLGRFWRLISLLARIGKQLLPP
jgi:hypothetical protein